jgi:bifunctional non-homologous end joining protein LigD
MTVQLSHLDKVFFPDDGITKGDLVKYYREMAPRILGYLRDRPLVLDRYPTASRAIESCRKMLGSIFPTGCAGPRSENRAARSAM